MQTAKKTFLSVFTITFLISTLTIHTMKRDPLSIKRYDQPVQKKQKTPNSCQLRISKSPKPIQAVLTPAYPPQAFYQTTAQHKETTAPLVINGQQATVTDLMIFVDTQSEGVNWTKSSLPSIRQKEINSCLTRNATYGIQGLTGYQKNAITKKNSTMTFPHMFPVKNLYGLNDGSKFSCTIHGKEVIVTCQRKESEAGDFKEQLEFRINMAKANSKLHIPAENNEFFTAKLFTKAVSPKGNTMAILYNNPSAFFGPTTGITPQKHGKNSFHTADKRGKTGTEKILTAPIIEKYGSLHNFVTQRATGQPKVFKK